MSSSGVQLEKFVIPLEKIRLATRNFSKKNEISEGDFGTVYRGQLENRTVAIDRRDPEGKLADHFFTDQIKVISTFHHQNIIPFIGYCHEAGEMVTVYEYTVNDSLQDHLEDPDKRRSLRWVDRLKICIGAARGLEYLHSGHGEDSMVIHRDVGSDNILLDGNFQVKLSNFDLSILVKRNQPQAYEPLPRLTYYMDPIYEGSRHLNTELDVYSFGVVLFEVLSGMMAYQTKSIDGEEPQNLRSLVRRYYDDMPHILIDPDIRDQMNTRSFKVFKEIAYQCISWNLKDRPKMDLVINRLEKALDFQNHRPSSTSIQSLEYENLKSFLIPLEEIRFATRDFSSGYCIREDEVSMSYYGTLSKKWKNCKARFRRLNRNRYERKHLLVNELKLLSRFNHDNILSFIGYCDEANEMIVVSESASKGSLSYHLRDPNRRSCLTWAQRLKICIGAAKGVDYLHTGLGENRAVIHKNLSSYNILLDDNQDTKICGFEMSLSVDRNQPQVFGVVEGIAGYCDPIYRESGLVNTAVDVYSYGVVLFETSCEMEAADTRSIDGGQPQTLINLVRRHYDDGLERLIDANIPDQINIHSLYTFKKIAYQCISMNVNDRPTMKRIVKRLEEALTLQNHGVAYSMSIQNRDNYLIPLNEIKLATRDFNPQTKIGSGGFGVVYKGDLSKNWQNCTVAIKCLNLKGRLDEKDFHNELNLISKFDHPNIIHFVGYCDEEDQMIIVFQYAANRSLDDYLADRIKMRSLSWTQRLKICLGAAKGCDYLHSEHGVIHRDIKSGNILLDGNLEAKICDFGLSTQGLRYQERSHIFTRVAGTEFYMDPVYSGSGILRKESDVYSFGVVMFEMLCGRTAYDHIEFVDGNPQHLINLVRRYYENGPKKLIDPDIRDEINSRSFHTFIEIAHQCINFISAERPTMEKIIEKIEDAIDFQDFGNIWEEADMDVSNEDESFQKAKSPLKKKAKDNNIKMSSREQIPMDLDESFLDKPKVPLGQPKRVIKQLYLCRSPYVTVLSTVQKSHLGLRRPGLNQVLVDGEVSQLLLHPYVEPGSAQATKIYMLSEFIGGLHKFYPEPIDAKFWKLLFNHEENGWLNNTHVSIWVRLLLEKMPPDANWTIMNSSFFEFMEDRDWRLAASGQVDTIYKGKSWWEVDRVYFPINISNTHWVLGEFFIDSLTLYIYDSFLTSDSIGVLERQGKLSLSESTVIETLDEIDYWRNVNISRKEVKINFVSVTHLPQQADGTGDCAVFMLKSLEQLVSGHKVGIAPYNAISAAQWFRYRMACIYASSLRISTLNL